MTDEDGIITYKLIVEPEIASGVVSDSLSLQFKIMDYEDRHIITNSGSQAELQSTNEQGSVVSGRVASSHDGVYNFEDIMIVGQPGNS